MRCGARTGCKGLGLGMKGWGRIHVCFLGDRSPFCKACFALQYRLVSDEIRARSCVRIMRAVGPAAPWISVLPSNALYLRETKFFLG